MAQLHLIGPSSLPDLGKLPSATRATCATLPPGATTRPDPIAAIAGLVLLPRSPDVFRWSFPRFHLWL